MENQNTETEVSRLRLVVEDLERRVSRIEGNRGGLPAYAEGDPGVRYEPAFTLPAFSGIFASVMLICFCLVGALILRVAAQQGAIAPMVGTGMGLFYCALLLALPLLARHRAWAKERGQVLQYCAVLLLPLIVVEMLHRYDALPVVLAAWLLVAAGAAGAVLGARRPHSPLVIVSLLAALTGLVGLGFMLEGLGHRLVAVLVIAVLALVFAHRAGWWQPRSWILFPVLAILGAAVLVTARREAVPEDARLLVLVAALCLWALLLVHHFVRGKALEESEAGWLALASLWAMGLLAFYDLSAAVWPLTVFVAAAALAGYALARPEGAGRFQGLGLSAAAAAVAPLPLAVLEPTGLALVVVAVVTWAAARRARSPVLWIVATVDALAATGLAFVRPMEEAAVRFPPPISVATVLLAISLMILWALMALRRPLPEEGPLQRGLAAVVLGCGFVLIFATGQSAILQSADTPANGQLGVTLLLAAIASAGLVVGRVEGFGTWRRYGFAGMVILGLKVVLYDLVRVGGSHAVVAVVILGVASGVTSWAIRQRRKASASVTPAADGPAPEQPGQ